MIVVVDSDGLIASLDLDDKHYPTALLIHSQLSQNKARLIYPATVIVETVTFLQGRLNRPDLAAKLMNQVLENQILVEDVDKEILDQAVKLMNLRLSKHHTLFDCIVAAIAQKHQADAIFSFDHFYKSKKFKLASEL